MHRNNKILVSITKQQCDRFQSNLSSNNHLSSVGRNRPAIDTPTEMKNMINEIRTFNSARLRHINDKIEPKIYEHTVITTKREKITEINEILNSNNGIQSSTTNNNNNNSSAHLY